MAGIQVKRLFVPVFFALATGVLINRYGIIKYVVIGGVFVMSFPALATKFCFNEAKKFFSRTELRSKSFFLMIIGLFLLIGYQLYGYHIAKDPLALFINEESLTLEADVESIREGDFATDYEVFSRQLIIKGRLIPLREKQTLRIYGIDHGYHPGDQIRINGPGVEGVYSQDKPLSSYDLYLKSRGIHNRLQASPSQVELLSREGVFHRAGLSGNRQKVLNFLDRSLQEPQNQLLKSVLFGNQGFLQEDLREAFAQTGTAHIIAVSGLHVGILVLLFTFFFRVLGLGKQLYLWLVLGIIFLYGYTIAFPISMVRAGIMYGLYILAFYQHRPYDGPHALAVVGVLSVLINPLTLFTVSFQLSFTATASILFLYPKLKKGLNFLPKYFRNLVAVTIAAQLGTLPLMAYYFGQVSVISIGANLLLMPTMGMLLSLGITGILLGLILEPLGMAVNLFTNGLLSYQITLIRLLQKMPGAFMEVGTFHFAWVVGYYIMIGSLYLYLEKRGLNYEMEGIQKASSTG